MAVSRSDRNRSSKDSVTEQVFWDKIDELEKKIRALTPRSGQAPQITSHPADRTLNIGGTATFNVTAIGQSPLVYQWYHDGDALPGETSAKLVLSNVTEDSEGEYWCVVSNGVGEATSNRATLGASTESTNVPIGGIIGYRGAFADIPSNWALCDGTGGTPNLVDRFILGTVTEAQVGNTGGTHQHYHQGGTLATAAVSGGTPDAHTTRNDVPAGGANTVLTGPASHAALTAHSHNVNAGKTAAPENGAASTAMLDVLPPWFKLAYIQRIS